ncbi:GFA family protein [Mesorhizobium comanense]|uniref:GFA family protein n=1 Tax=Mesorhizobium comanense TaxID=2502215 RepID=UPI0010FA3E68|nr:aldehyde-activating protein [Mesorhizobium comanense]
MTEHAGGCHCGNIRLRFSTELDPSQIEVRACQCGFCVKHASRAAADPDGRLTVAVKDIRRLHKYRFGLRTADYLICSECGVYVAAIAAADAVARDDDARAIVIVNALDDQRAFSRQPVPVDFDGESTEQRQARRRLRWMPVELSFG